MTGDLLKPLCLSAAGLRKGEPGQQNRPQLKSQQGTLGLNLAKVSPSRHQLGTSLVDQWLRICLPRQGTWVRSLVRELRSHLPLRIHVTTREKPAHHKEKPRCCNLRPDTAKSINTKKKKRHQLLDLSLPLLAEGTQADLSLPVKKATSETPTRRPDWTRVQNN